ncbi:MAG TPA: response regulator [Gemmatimonadales bacterium]|nr:response regulator [Gemmatimonadales bacterium]
MTLTAAAPIRILLVEDNPGDARLILEVLTEMGAAGFTLEKLDRLEPALERMRGAALDVVLLDLGLPDSQGLATFERARMEAPTQPIIVISGLDDEQVALEAVRSGAQDYLVKGRIEGHLLGRVIRYAIERQRAEQRLRTSETMYRSLVANSPFGIQRVSPEGRVLSANPALVAMLGYDNEDEVLKLDMARDVYAVAAERASQVSNLIAQGELTVESEWKRRDGTRIRARRTGRVVRSPDGDVLYFDIVVEDVTQQRVTEQQLAQARKMEAIGQLAGGVAHDFNNLLTVILGSSDLLLETVAADSPDRAEIGDIRQAALRAAELTRQLLAFSRQQVLQPQALDLNHVVEGMQKMLGRLIGEDVELRTALDASLGTVRADPGQMEQIILNLAVNARDAMPDGGHLTIETANADLDATYVAAHSPALPGPYVMLAVTDTGMGMDQATQSRVFEPFFTTKEQGKGTGLGLATVYGIVKQSGGLIWLYSEPGQGATFKIYLPRITAAATAHTVPPDPRALRGTETVLVVEDDSTVRSLTQRVLAGQGYTVLVADSGAAALALVLGHAGAIDLLITDVVMPGMSGRDLGNRFIEARPTARVLFLSGYPGEAIARRGILEAGVNFLQKPFTVEALGRKVREVLEAEGRKPARE